MTTLPMFTLREARRRRKLTQDDLAEKSGVDQTTISSIETGRRRLTDTIRPQLARALGIAPSRLRSHDPGPDHATVTDESDRVGHTTTPEAVTA